MLDNTARTIATVAIWLSNAVVLTFGVFRENWNGNTGLLGVVATVLLLSGAATVSTAFVWSGARRRWPSGGRGFEPLPVTGAAGEHG